MQGAQSNDTVTQPEPFYLSYHTYRELYRGLCILESNLYLGCGNPGHSKWDYPTAKGAHGTKKASSTTASAFALIGATSGMGYGRNCLYVLSNF